MRRLRPTAPLLFALAAAWLLPAPARACDCDLLPPPEQELAMATAVFEGKVARLEIDPGTHRQRVTLEVSRVWKGAVTTSAKVASFIDDGFECGFDFAVGQSYLIYADGEVTSLSTSSCSRTAPSSEAQADFAALGPGKSPASGKPVELAKSPNARGCAIGAHGGHAGWLAVLVLFGVRRRRRPRLSTALVSRRDRRA